VKTIFRATNIRCLRPYRLADQRGGMPPGILLIHATPITLSTAHRWRYWRGSGVPTSTPAGRWTWARCKTINGLIGTGV